MRLARMHRQTPDPLTGPHEQLLLAYMGISL